jgi:hypothetical protein
LRVDPTYAWTLAATPLLAALVPFAVPTLDADAQAGIGLVLALAAQIGLGLLDHSRLREAGVDISSGWILLTPGYLIVRTMRARSTPAIPVVWFLAAFASLVVASLVPVGAEEIEMDAPRLEIQLQRAIERQHNAATTVHCPQGRWSFNAVVGEPFACQVKAVDGRFSVYVTVTDDAGHYDWIVTQ